MLALTENFPLKFIVAASDQPGRQTQQPASQLPASHHAPAAYNGRGFLINYPEPTRSLAAKAIPANRGGEARRGSAGRQEASPCEASLHLSASLFRSVSWDSGSKTTLRLLPFPRGLC